jgi:sarcosine oxidase
VTRNVDVVVIGGGVMGTAAARWLAKRGRDTVLLERFGVGNDRGSSGGPTRIFRITYEHPDYVRMARRALEDWRALEAEADESLLITTAGLDVGPQGRRSADALGAAGEPYEYLSADAVAERWPAIRLERDAEVFVQEDGGVCMAERTVLAQARLAAAAGATVLDHTEVERLEATGTGATVHAGGETFHAPVALVTAGPWSAALLRGTGLDLPLVPSFEQATHFQLEDPSPLPTVIDWTVDPPRTPYTVPDPEMPGRFKIALHMTGPSIDADARPSEPDPERVRRVTGYASTRYAAHHATGRTDLCMYTNTPDEDFVLDRRGSVVIGSPCSGHGFKFAPLIGRILADLATAQPAPMPIERFLAYRFGV